MAGTGRTRQRQVAGSMVVTSVALALASVSWACTVPVGFTWYSDGTFSKSGPAGTSITAYATQARAQQRFFLVAGNAEGEPGHEGHACMFNFVNLNPNQRVSSASGVIGLTAGTVNVAPGTWQICFREVGGATGTVPVHFTVV